MAKDNKFELGPNHRPGMRVPKGGSSCAKCEYLTDDQKGCSNKYFIKWHGSDRLPAPADEYCSDWYEPAKGTMEGKDIRDIPFEEAGL